MNRIFGQKKEAKPTPTLTEAQGRLDLRQQNLDAKIKASDDELRKYQVQIKKTKGAAQAGLKKRAMEVLKRKKMYEQQRDQLAAQSFNVDQTSFALDSVKDTMSTVDAMKGAHKALKTEVKKVAIGTIEDTMDDLADMMEDMNELQEALGRNYSVPGDVDEADLDAELAALEDDLEGLDVEAEPDAAGQPSYLQSTLPSEPTTTLPAAPAGSRVSATDEYGLPVAPLHN